MRGMHKNWRCSATNRRRCGSGSAPPLLGLNFRYTAYIYRMPDIHAVNTKPPVFADYERLLTFVSISNVWVTVE